MRSMDGRGCSRIERMLALPEGEIWVFGYGSLMWRPGFTYLEARLARLNGLHRALCVWSWVHRGTPERPGLVMGLDRGGACVGRAYRIAAGARGAVLDYLHAREMATPVYQPALRRIRLDGRVERALLFVVDRAHAQYAGRLAPESAARVIAGAVGASGANPDYLADMVAHLDGLGIHDAWLRRTHALVRRAASGRRPAALRR